MSKVNLIVRDLEEVVGEDIKILQKIVEKRALKIYWGTAPTGRIHIGYFVPLLKIADFLEAGCQVKILIADLHASLDNLKSTFKQVEKRSEYYEMMIKEMLHLLGVSTEQLLFVKGSDYQLSRRYTLDVYRLNSLTKLGDAKHAGAEVVKQTDNPVMNGLLYPGLQTLDEEYLQVDAQFGGVDQRKIFMMAREFLPKMGYKKRIHLINKLVPGLKFEKTKKESPKEEEIRKRAHAIWEATACEDHVCNWLKAEQELMENKFLEKAENKMSSSKQDSKIDILNGKGKLRKKINRAYCYPGDAQDNSLMVMLEKLLFPILNRLGLNFVIKRKEEYGGDIDYTCIEDVVKDFTTPTEKYAEFAKTNPDECNENFVLHPADLKQGIIQNLDQLLSPIRQKFQEKNLRKLVLEAYK